MNVVVDPSPGASSVVLEFIFELALFFAGHPVAACVLASVVLDVASVVSGKFSEEWPDRQFFVVLKRQHALLVVCDAAQDLQLDAPSVLLDVLFVRDALRAR